MKETEKPTKRRTRTPEQDALLGRVRSYQVIMGDKNAEGNRINALVRSGHLTKDEAKELLDGLCRKRRRIMDGIIKKAAKLIKGMPVYKTWLSKIDGIGENLAVQWIAHLQPISDFPTVGHLWAYCGLKVENGKAVRRERGKKLSGVPEIKVLAHQTAESWIKKPNCWFRGVYDRYKARDRSKHPEPVQQTQDGKPLENKDGTPKMLYSDLHIHLRAMRYTVKLFLSLLWERWREIEGLPIRGPYAVEYLGHTTVITPDDAISFSARTKEVSVRNNKTKRLKAES